MHYRTLFLSDCHLGSRGCRAQELAAFLGHVRCERLYLVGDIVDMWRLRQKWYWPTEHNQVLQRLFHLARHGTEVIFIPGNHDESARQFLGADFGGIRVLPYAIHHTLGGQRLLVTHGDQFDLVVMHSRFISMIGAKAYEWLLWVNSGYNSVRRRFRLPQRSLSKAIKLRVKHACTFISNFEESLMQEARNRGFDGVVCGHIHQAEARAATSQAPVAYYNCGDWVEGCTAVVEDPDGAVRLIDAERTLKRHLRAVRCFNGDGHQPETRWTPRDELPPLATLIAAERVFAVDADESRLTFR